MKKDDKFLLMALSALLLHYLSFYTIPEATNRNQHSYTYWSHIYTKVCYHPYTQYVEML